MQKKEPRMLFDFSRLTGRIIERFGSRRAFCAQAGFTEATLSSRLLNQTHFKGPEIYLICELLGILPEEIPAYFFTPKVL